ncbi:MAG: 50S ribosomal protein L18e [archaeon]
MKRTGPTNIRTRALVVHLEKHAPKTNTGKKKEGAYAVLSQLINVPTRQRAEVNLSHLNAMAGTYKDKVFVVPGAVLAKGAITHPIHVAALRFSGNAARKIIEAKGKAMLLEELVAEKIEPSKLVLVK